ncbi:hypothetical protein PATA110616_20795 [Paenibacillus tarimensis]
MLGVWKFIMLFIVLFILYGVFELVTSYINEGNINFQAIILIVGMVLSLLTARYRYHKLQEKKKV